MRILISLLLIVFPISGVALAETTTYKQQILPIDCIYEVIDVGTQKLRYLTPATCPVDPGPPVITEPSGGSTDAATNANWVYSAPIAIAPPTIDSQDNQNEEVKGSTEQIRDIVYRNQDGILIIALISLIWVGVIIVLKRRNVLN